jgi:hypothetical protein
LCDLILGLFGVRRRGGREDAIPQRQSGDAGGPVEMAQSDAGALRPNRADQVVDGIYGYRSGGDGVGHGGAVGGAATSEVAELILAVCASLIIFLVDASKSPRSHAPD